MFNPKSWQTKPLAGAHPSAAYPIFLVSCLLRWPWFRCSRQCWFRHMVPNIHTADLSLHQYLYLVAMCFNDLILEYLRRGKSLPERPPVCLPRWSIFTRISGMWTLSQSKSSVPQEIAHSGCVGQITGEKVDLRQQIFCVLKPPWTSAPNLSHPRIKQSFVARRQMTNQYPTTTCTYVNEPANAHSVFVFQNYFFCVRLQCGKIWNVPG